MQNGMHDYDTLEDYIKNKMKMTHIYQPLMIKTLLESKDKTASVESIVKAFLDKDLSQLDYYKKIVKRWPQKTLKSHNVVEYSRSKESDKDGVYTLLLDEITEEQRKRLIELCDGRLNEFIDKDPWIREFRMQDQKDVPSSLATQVRAKCKGVCVACGARALETPMDIDHIKPHSLGGTTTLDNLQLLCYRCNREKRNTDETNFMLYHNRLKFRKHSCTFCNPRHTLHENNLAYVLGRGDGYVIAPHSHVGSFRDLIPAEKQLCFDLVDRLGQKHDKFDVQFVSGEHCSMQLDPM